MAAYNKDIRKELDKALKEFVKGKPHKHVNKPKTAIDKLIDKISIDTTALQQQIFDVALFGFDQILPRTQAILGPTHPEMQKALQLRASALALAAQGDWAAAAKALKRAANIEKFIDKIMKDYEKGKIPNNTAYVGNFCTAGGEPYLASQCQMQGLLDQLQSLSATYPADTDLASAAIAMRDGVTWQSILKLDKASDAYRAAGTALLASPVDTSAQRASLVETFRATVRVWLDDASRYWPAGAKEIVSAESLYQQALTAQAAGDTVTALNRLRDAIRTAKP